ncbi:MAG: hypothetical protein ABSE71_02455 [Candidatus Micrarchaeaceae archaeon]|jgi:hypothetical protein|nr:hypothetical protein [Candidatus Micrarchaeota archaeon]HII09969.1 hypothetical protein [Candidatus Micrarchaeota archaeon]
MAIKYWEFEDAPLKDKLKSVNVKEVAKIFFDNETEAYRFATLLLEVKKARELRLKNVPKDIPIATAKRYLDFGVALGLLKHENSTYIMTDRFSKPLRNIATYIKAWQDSQNEEDLSVQFANAKMEKQQKRGGVTRDQMSGSESEAKQ